jgi:hypothetical protein
MTNLIYPVEPVYYESLETLSGRATFAFNNPLGFALDDELAIATGAITSVTTTYTNYAIFPVCIPPTFVSWSSSVVTAAVGSPYCEIKTDYEPDEWQLMGSASLTTLNPKGSKLYIRAVFPTSANAASISNVEVNYMMSFASIDDVEKFSDIDNENTTGVGFTDSDKTHAIQYANARILYRIKDWHLFYTERLDYQVKKLLIQTESMFAAAILFERKANQFINIASTGESFSVGDFSITQDPTKQKTFYAAYHALADRYNKEANQLLNLIMPAGENTIKSTFYFDNCISVEAAEDDAIAAEEE